MKVKFILGIQASEASIRKTEKLKYSKFCIIITNNKIREIEVGEWKKS